MAARPVSRITGSPVFLILALLLIGIVYVKRHDTQRPPAWVQRLKETQDAAYKSFYSDRVHEIEDAKDHPVKALHEQATHRYRAMLDRQSQTVDEATEEYKRRYRRKPPPGFDKWFEFAKRRGSAIIDEFDMIAESIEPFWAMSPSTIRTVMQRASGGPRLWTFSIHGGHAISSEDNWMGRLVAEALGPAAADIPNVDLLMNPLDEPRVLLSKRREVERIVWTDHSMRPAWSAVSSPCSHLKRKHRSRGHPRVNTHGLPFVVDHWSSIDLCQNPSFAKQHGFFLAPYSLLTTASPVPILSQAAPSTFSDILYPSMWYWDHVIPDFEEHDPPWEDKANKVYWAGSTTGGYNRNHTAASPAWSSHRHRFVKMTRQIGEGVYQFLTRSNVDRDMNGTVTPVMAGEEGKTVWTRYESEEVLAKLYDTKFTSTVQCDDFECERMQDYYQVTNPEDPRIPFKSRFLFDLDGNSFSGRFYGFLRSRACPIKQTIFREWHDERLVPWVHYVPISVGLEELPETVRYLALTTEGNAIAKKIADEGRAWYYRALRKEDAAVYLYRLLLEYARVSSEGRDEMQW